MRLGAANGLGHRVAQCVMQSSKRADAVGIPTQGHELSPCDMFQHRHFAPSVSNQLAALRCGNPSCWLLADLRRPPAKVGRGGQNRPGPAHWPDRPPNRHPLTNPLVLHLVPRSCGHRSRSARMTRQTHQYQAFTAIQPASLGRYSGNLLPMSIVEAEPAARSPRGNQPTGRCDWCRTLARIGGARHTHAIPLGHPASQPVGEPTLSTQAPLRWRPSRMSSRVSCSTASHSRHCCCCAFTP